MDAADREWQWTMLMERALQGDACAYRDLLLKLTMALRAALSGRARTAGLDVEDLVQEVLLALHLKRGTWIAGTPVAPWVAAIARNKLIDALRRRGKRTEVSLESVLESLSVDSSAVESHAYDVAHLLGQLNERQRAVVYAVSLQGYSAQEAAERLQMSEGAVRVMLHRSLKSLAAMLQEGSK